MPARSKAGSGLFPIGAVPLNQAMNCSISAITCDEGGASKCIFGASVRTGDDLHGVSLRPVTADVM